MGDQWLSTTDMNGILNLGVLLVRKWTGYKPRPFGILSDDHERNVELSIQSATLVDEFQKAVLKHAQSCGIRSCLSDTFEDNALYCKTVQLVHQKLAKGELEVVTQLLYQQLVKNNIKKVASKSTRVQADKLLVRVAADIPNLQQQFLAHEHEWLSNSECTVKTMNSEDISSMQQSQQLVGQQCPAAAITTMNRTSILKC